MVKCVGRTTTYCRLVDCEQSPRSTPTLSCIALVPAGPEVRTDFEAVHYQLVYYGSTLRLAVRILGLVRSECTLVTIIVEFCQEIGMSLIIPKLSSAGSVALEPMIPSTRSLLAACMQGIPHIIRNIPPLRNVELRERTTHGQYGRKSSRGLA